eukprot:scaffold100486_cov21-Tisochrysis_lutea.AAC.1
MGARISPSMKGGLPHHPPSPVLAPAAAAPPPPQPPHAAYRVVPHAAPHLVAPPPLVPGVAAAVPPPVAANPSVSHSPPAAPLAGMQGHHRMPQPHMSASVQMPYHPGSLPNLTVLVQIVAKLVGACADLGSLSHLSTCTARKTVMPGKLPRESSIAGLSLTCIYVLPSAMHTPHTMRAMGLQRAMQAPFSAPPPAMPGRLLLCQRHPRARQRLQQQRQQQAEKRRMRRKGRAPVKPAACVALTRCVCMCVRVCVCVCARARACVCACGEEDNWLDTGLPKSTALAIHEMTQDEMSMKRITFQVRAFKEYHTPGDMLTSEDDMSMKHNALQDDVSLKCIKLQDQVSLKCMKFQDKMSMKRIAIQVSSRVCVGRWMQEEFEQACHLLAVLTAFPLGRIGKFPT